MTNQMTDQTTERVTFGNGATELVGDLHLPAGFDESRRYAAIVTVHPGSSVKEQTSGLYARRMAELGYVALAFDASYQGESAGEPRHLEDPAARVSDVWSAVDLLTTLGYVDEERIGVLGVCAGGGYAVNAALTDHRISAVGVVSVINIGRAYRETGGPEGDVLRTLATAARQRTAEARGAEPTIVPWTPESREAAVRAGLTDADLLEAVDYYRTLRGAHPRSANRLLARSAAPLLGFDAFHLVEELLTQPLQVVVGDRVGSFGSYRDGHELFRRARGPKDLLVVDGAGHYDLYDRPEHVDQAVARLGAFYAEALRS
ncbi:hypothetical protein APR03_002649 [Promicromonospora thailandica]|uniref:Dienelactone hydrolase domain-containing protein n=2 Tax=Promicromonospora thailandica TaxID=765201 RepID=A0A9X2JWL4_9MICO|nr:hypothetical protein [Promicromonospora thailandica]BFF16818.1 alpha/beta hydrolase [Promicromonospora thailandica]